MLVILLAKFTSASKFSLATGGMARTFSIWLRINCSGRPKVSFKMSIMASTLAELPSSGSTVSLARSFKASLRRIMLCKLEYPNSDVVLLNDSKNACHSSGRPVKKGNG